MGGAMGVIVGWWKYLLSHAVLASGFVVYDWASPDARPIHALLVFTFFTAAVMLVFEWDSIRKTTLSRAWWMVLIQAGLYCLYFLFLLAGISGSNAGTAALVITMSVCTNGALAVYLKHRRIDLSLMVFIISIFLIILLLKSKGAPQWATFDFYFLLLFAALAAELASAFIRRVYCKRANLAPANMAKAGLTLSILPTVAIALCDFSFYFGEQASLLAIATYDIWAFAGWAYLGIFPNIVMLTWSVECEGHNAVRYHSLTGLKFIFSGLIMLIFPSILYKSPFYWPSAMIVILSILLISLIYLYNIQDKLLELLKGQSGKVSNDGEQDRKAS